MFASPSSSYSPFPQDTFAHLPAAANPRVISTCGQTPRFALFWPQLSPLTIFRMSTYRSVSKHATSSPLDSALTQNRGGGGTPAQVPPQSHLTTIPALGCLHPCTMEMVTMESKRTTPQTTPARLRWYLNHGMMDAIPAAFQVRGERHNHETQLQNLHGNSTARGHLFRWSARGIQPDFRRHSNRSAAATARLRSPSSLPRPRSRIQLGRRLLVSGQRPLRLARGLLDSPAV